MRWPGLRLFRRWNPALWTGVTGLLFSLSMVAPGSALDIVCKLALLHLVASSIVVTLIQFRDDAR